MTPCQCDIIAKHTKVEKFRVNTFRVVICQTWISVKATYKAGFRSHLIYYTGAPATTTIIVTDVQLTNFTISWTVPEVDTNNNMCGPVMYNVTISGFLFINVTSIGSNTSSFIGLTPNTSYIIIVIPYNSAGNGPPASTVVTTLVPSG